MTNSNGHLEGERGRVLGTNQYTSACTVLDGCCIMTTPKVLATVCRKGKLLFGDENEAEVKKKGDVSKSKKSRAGRK